MTTERHPTASRIGVMAVGLLVALMVAFVVVGMITGLDRTFDRGTAPLSAMLIQEALGVVSLAALAAVALRLPQFARGRGRGRTALLFVLACVVCGLWVWSRIAEYAS